MRIGMTLLVVSLAVAPAACKKKKAETSTSTTEMGSNAGSGSAMGSGSATGSGSAMGSGSAGSAMGSAGSDMGSAAGSGSAASDTGMAHHAGMCPSTVYGATTTVAVKGKTAIVTVSAKDKHAVASIQKRTDEMLKQKKPGMATSDAHDQKGTHGGSMGLCPVYVPEGATAKAKHVKQGVAVTITPKDNPAGLKADIDARIEKTNAWVKENVKPGDKGTMGAVGGGKGEHGSNHSGKGDSKGKTRKGGDGNGGGAGTGGGSGGGTGGGSK